MTQFFDAVGSLHSSIQTNNGGQHTITNAMGQITQVFHPTGAGSGYWADPYGPILSHVQKVGDIHQHFDASHKFIGSVSKLGNNTVFNNAVGVMTGMHDPMTGNFSNGIGQLIGYSR